MTKGIIPAVLPPGVVGTSTAFAMTPRAASDGPDFGVRTGTAFRMVLDIGDPGLGRTINTRGPSGDPASPHDRDPAPLRAAGADVPLPSSRGAVETGAAEVLTLTP